MGEPLIQQEDLTLIANLYDRVRKLYKGARANKDEELNEAFQRVIRKTVGGLSRLLKDDSKADTVPVHVIASKFELHQFCGGQLAGFIELKDSKSSELLRQMLAHQAACFQELVKLSLSYREELNEAASSKATLEQEIEAVLQAAEHLEQATIQAQHERDSAVAELISYRDDSNAKTAVLHQENRGYLEKSIKPEKSSKTRALSPKSPRKISTPPRPTNYIQAAYHQQLYIKDLTLRQLRDFLDEIYSSKKKFDSKCVEMQQGRETMELHISTFFSQKYGLKSLSQEWYASVVRAVGKYEGDDSEVCAFGYILRHEVDEEFRQRQEHLKHTVTELLRQQIKTVYPFMGEAQVKEVLHDKLNGDLSEEDWVGVVGSLYDGSDAQYLIDLLQQLKNSKPLPKRRNRDDVVEDPKLPFSEFLKIVLDFQLASYRELLRPFLEKFKQVDLDHNGIVSQAEFSELIKLCNLEDYLSRLMEQIDAFNTLQVTLSDCVKLLNTVKSTQEQVDASREQLSLLQKVFFDGTQLIT